jgi:hypothetical protein
MVGAAQNSVRLVRTVPMAIVVLHLTTVAK